MDEQSGGAGANKYAMAVVNLFNGIRNRKLSKDLAAKKEIHDRAMEAMRQDFQMEAFECNAELQHQLARENHAYRLQEQEENFKRLIVTEQWKSMIGSWPLHAQPIVLRHEQVLDDNTVRMNVFFACGQDTPLGVHVCPAVEYGLRTFTSLYTSRLGSRNLHYVHRGWKSGDTGGAVNDTLYYALGGMPTLIIEAETVGRMIYVTGTVWGFGSGEKTPVTILRIPYDPIRLADTQAYEYHEQLAGALLGPLKYFIGYMYDAYCMIEYDRLPALPQVMALDASGEETGQLALVPDIRREMARDYLALLGQAYGGDDTVRLMKGADLPRLKLGFARAMANALDSEQMLSVVWQALEDWAFYRTKAGAQALLEAIEAGKYALVGRVSQEDKGIFAEAYRLLGAHMKANSELPPPLGAQYEALRFMLLACYRRMTTARLKGDGRAIIVLVIGLGGLTAEGFLPMNRKLKLYDSDETPSYSSYRSSLEVDRRGMMRMESMDPDTLADAEIRFSVYEMAVTGKRLPPALAERIMIYDVPEDIYVGLDQDSRRCILDASHYVIVHLREAQRPTWLQKDQKDEGDSAWKAIYQDTAKKSLLWELRETNAPKDRGWIANECAHMPYCRHSNSTNSYGWHVLSTSEMYLLILLEWYTRNKRIRIPDHDDVYAYFRRMRKERYDYTRTITEKLVGHMLSSLNRAQREALAVELKRWIRPKPPIHTAQQSTAPPPPQA